MSEHATELTRLRGMTLIAEDAQIRPAAMSYVKPSEYRYYAERAMQHMVDETTTHATAHATVQAERKIAEDRYREVTKELEEAKREKLAWQQAAYVAGECVATTGPEGYYEMAPADWRDWLIADVQQQLATARADALQRRIEGGTHGR